MEKRLNDHKYRLKGNRHGNIHLQGAWNKYGGETFTFGILISIEEYTIEGIRQAEQELLDSYAGEKWDLLFNIAPTVDMSVMAEDTKIKIGNASRGRVASKETREIMGKRMKATWQDPEFRKNFAIKHTVAVNHPDSVAKVSETSKERWANPEYKQKRKKSMLKEWENPERKQKMANRVRKSGSGIYPWKNTSKYKAQISNKGKTVHLGIFDNYEQALAARLNAEKLYWGESNGN